MSGENCIFNKDVERRNLLDNGFMGIELMLSNSNLKSRWQQFQNIHEHFLPLTFVKRLEQIFPKGWSRNLQLEWFREEIPSGFWQSRPSPQNPSTDWFRIMLSKYFRILHGGGRNPARREKRGKEGKSRKSMETI